MSQKTSGRPMRLLAMLVLMLVVLALGSPVAEGQSVSDQVDEALQLMLELPYQPDYVPIGTDAAFGSDDYPASFPLTDTTTGTCCAGPVPDQPPLADLAPPFADWPDGFELIELRSHDRTPLHAFVSITDPAAPGIVVMHGFNTNGKYSIVRYAAFLRANGFNVIAPDHRDMGREWERGGSWWPEGPRHGQTLGWKESEDLLAAAAELSRRGIDRIGVLGLSEGAQNTILALARDLDGVIDAALTFSPPADQATLLQRNAETSAALLTTVVNNPDACDYLTTVGQLPEFNATANFMLRNDSAVDALDGIVGAVVDTPAAHFLAEDDELVPSWNAIALASRTLSMPSQRTLLIEQGNHAYFYDRWWTQKATLAWFHYWLDEDGAHTSADTTVAQTPGGTPLADQTVDLTGTTREEGDAELRERAFCPPADEPVGPNALLSVGGDGPTRTVDGRRSYSGWDDHRIAGWRIDPGDGSAPVTGSAVHEAITTHTYDSAGTYDITLTVTDDTGRTAATTTTIEVAGAPSPTPSPTTGDEGAPATDDGPGLPATGGSAALAGALLLAAGLGLVGWRRRPETTTTDRR